MRSTRVLAAVLTLVWAAAGCTTATAADRAAATSAATLGGRVDLNEAGALEAVARTNPAHYDKIRRIFEGILQQPDASVPRWIQANFDGRDVSYAPIVLTSHPPKRRLSFVLDATRYEAVIVLANVRGDIVPLR